MRQKTTTKSVHITLLALLLIQVFVFIILYYSDMFMILSSGEYNVEEDTQAIRAEGKTERSSHILKHSRSVLVVVSVYELACAYSTQALEIC